MTHNFQNVAVLCDTWQQMLHLAKLAKAQGYRTDKVLFSRMDFLVLDHIYFAVENREYLNLTEIAANSYIKTTYTTFINPPTDDSVYGC
jgi:hypothetical protein